MLKARMLHLSYYHKQVHADAQSLKCKNKPVHSVLNFLSALPL